MGGRPLKKKSAKARRETILKDPFIILHALINVTDTYLVDLNTDFPLVPNNVGKTFRFTRISHEDG